LIKKNLTKKNKEKKKKTLNRKSREGGNDEELQKIYKK
jgi:hypothetical protein